MSKFPFRGGDERPALRRSPEPRPAPLAARPRARGETGGPDEFAAPPPAAPAHDLPGSRSGPARHELKVCGLTAVRARFAKDPDSIQRLFFDYATGRQVGVISKVLAQKKKIYRCVEPAELEKVAGTVHHGGIVAVVTPPALRSATAEDAAKWGRRGEALLVLDRIGNAHNLGAIARTAAFFGVPRIVIPDDPAAARPTDAAFRVAEGGLDHVEVWTVPALVPFAAALKAAGFEVVGAATRGGRPEAAGKRGAETKPVALILGNEEHGLAPELTAACSRLVTIPGGGAVESLNVSVAAAVLMWELVAKAAPRGAARPVEG
ncbi:MAG: RNA methyltransferase [Opitutia bacterium Tous-C1TDCM]|nr:MAG: RNA methyltransferase [Opitutae bacterium Tous-C1TDCM]